MSNTRQPGYYWVKYKDYWQVAEYGTFYDWLDNLETGWHLFGTATSYCSGEYVGDPIFSDSAFDEVNENRIPSPDEMVVPSKEDLERMATQPRYIYHDPLHYNIHRAPRPPIPGCNGHG